MVTNLSHMSVEYFHPKTTPNIPVRKAVKMSMALPGIVIITVEKITVVKCQETASTGYGEKNTLRLYVCRSRQFLPRVTIKYKPGKTRSWEPTGYTTL